MDDFSGLGGSFIFLLLLAPPSITPCIISTVPLDQGWSHGEKLLCCVIPTMFLIGAW